MSTSTVDPEEVERFSRIADEWWNPSGKFKPLHTINPLRVGYIHDQIQRHFPNTDIQSLTLLDIGCGGGLIAEPMARLGTKVTGIDASEKNIAVAKLHAAQSNLTIDYRATTAEALLTSPSPFQGEGRGEGYDIVLALEIIEHVADISAFVAATSQLVKPGGLIIYSTLNRTAKSFALAIVGAEYILRWLPRGTHTWKKFVKPSELARELRAHDIAIKEMTGMTLNPLDFKWHLDAHDLAVNYLLTATKPLSSRA